MGHKVRIASFGLNRIFLDGYSQYDMASYVKEKLVSIRNCQKDLVVLPELFLETGGDTDNPDWEMISEDMLSYILEYAKLNNCYVIAPLVESYGRDSKKYNTAFVIDRTGNIFGKYRKMHPVVEEMTEHDFVPGDELPVFDLDFGRIGLQICFDIGWRDGWKALADKGAQMVVWVSAYDGGNLLNMYAAYNMYYVVSAVRSDHVKIIDLTGRTIACGGKWNGLVMATVDLETTLFHKDRQFKKIDLIRRDLGDKVTINTYSEENVFTVESNDPEWTIRRICDTYGIMPYKAYHKEADCVRDDFLTICPLENSDQC